MKRNYEPMTFSADAEQNKAILQDRDYHTLCVIQDATGYTPSGDTMAAWVKSGESFTINPAWPCCKGREWYAQAAKQ